MTLTVSGMSWSASPDTNGICAVTAVHPVTAGPVTWEELDAMTSEPGVPQIYSTDSTGGIFSDYSWYAYNLLGAHKLWPNYRTYLIRADVDDPDSRVWSLQVVGYYDENGNSGNPIIRWYPVDLE